MMEAEFLKFFSPSVCPNKEANFNWKFSFTLRTLLELMGLLHGEQFGLEESLTRSLVWIALIENFVEFG